MKQKTRIIGLLLLLLFSYKTIYAASEKQSFEVKWKWAETATANDSLNDKTIIVDGNQITYLKTFLNDRIDYLETDSLLQVKIDSLQSSFLEFQLKVEKGDYCGTYLWVRISLIVLAVFLLLLIIYLIYRFGDLREEVIENVTSSNRVKELISKINGRNDFSSQVKSYNEDIQGMRSENRELKNKVAQLENALKSLETNRSFVIEKPRENNQLKSQVQLMYADYIDENGVFSHVTEKPDDDTFFVLTMRGDDYASITLYQQAYGKIIANPAFLEGCEKQIIGSTTVIVTDEGVAKREGNGKWRVTQKAIVEIR